jgi:thioredoxin 1
MEDIEIERIRERKLHELMERGVHGAPDVSSPGSSGAPITLSDSDFHSQVRSHPVMVVDFWAPWCGPCRVVSPILEELSREMAGKATFGKLNVDDNQAVAQEFGIQGIPTIMIFKNGEAVDGLVGAAPKEMIADRIRPHLGGGASRSSPYQ